jgi:hypothetical protein
MRPDHGQGYHARLDRFEIVAIPELSAPVDFAACAGLMQNHN